MTQSLPPAAAQQRRPQLAAIKSKLSRSPLLSDKKLIRNAICTDWPANFLANKHTVVISSSGQLRQVRDAQDDSSFAPPYLTSTKSKPLQPALTVGLSKDSPFHLTGGQYTQTHP